MNRVSTIGALAADHDARQKPVIHKISVLMLSELALKCYKSSDAPTLAVPKPRQVGYST